MFMFMYIYELLPTGCFAAAAATAVSRHHHRSWRWISPHRSCLLALFVCRVTSEIRVPGRDRNRPHCSYDRPKSIVTASADRHDRLSTATSWAAWYSGRSEAGRLLWPLRPLAFTLLGLWIYFAQTRSYLAAFENCWWWSGPFWISCLNLRCYKIAALFQRLAPRQHLSMPQHASATWERASKSVRVRTNIIGSLRCIVRASSSLWTKVGVRCLHVQNLDGVCEVPVNIC